MDPAAFLSIGFPAIDIGNRQAPTCRMERLLAVALATAALITAPLLPAAADCACRYPEGKVQEGETACIRTPDGRQLAVCEKVLNNSSWRFTGRPCPAAAIGLGREGLRQG